MEMLASSSFWVTLGQIIMIDIVLSGDNAVVIALASRSLPPHQQKRAILLGSFGAIFLRITLTFFAVMLLDLPFLKLTGALLLGWIAIRMLAPDDDEGASGIDGHAHMWQAIRTIIVADLVMSLDNVLGVAAAAKGSTLMLVIGLAMSIPMMIYGSTFILRLMNRFPVIITLGGGILGWVAGEMLVSDPGLAGWIDSQAHWLHSFTPAAGALLVVAAGKLMAAARLAKADRLPEEPLTLPGNEDPVPGGAGPTAPATGP